VRELTQKDDPFKYRHPLNNTNPGDWEDPFKDVFVDEEGGEVIILLDLRGVAEEDVSIHMTNTSMHVKADRGKTKYKANIPLDIEINPESTKAIFNNGILEIKAPVKKEELDRIKTI
jgi:HSP20 family protein